MLEARRIALLSVASHAATLLFLLCYFWVLVITAIDSARFYVVFPYRNFVAGVLLVLVVLLPGRSWRLNFVINAGTIHKGMRAEVVRAKMKPFLSVTSSDGTEMTFQHAPASREWCIV